MRIKFTKPYTVKAAGGESYQAGQEVEVSEASARHFINRGVAEEPKQSPATKAAAGGKVEDKNKTETTDKK